MNKIMGIKIMSRFTRQGEAPCHSSAGFSLIELLVVISLISLLMGILMPALSRSRAIAKEAVCQSWLRQWGIAFEMYASENDGFYPHIDGLDRDAGIADRFGWVDMLPPLMGEKPWRDHDYWQRPGTGTIFQCPSAKLAPDKSYKYRPRRSGYFSYAMNSCLELDGNCWKPYGYKGTGWHMPSFLKTTSIRSPYRVILLFDQLLDPEKGYGGKGQNPTARPSGLLGGSILYCDYHVQWTETVWKPDWPDDLEVPPRDDSDWYPYP